MEARTEDALVNEYVELRVKSGVRIKESDLEDFYRGNEKEFKGEGYEAVRDRIEEYLVEKETNRVLKAHLEELRKRAYVRINMTGEEGGE